MHSYTLTDATADLRVERFGVTPADLGLPAQPAWSITQRTLQGGRRQGVDLIEIDNGALAIAVIPTRGMGLWRGRYHAEPLGWRSPVRDGPVHPAFVNLMGWGGKGWLDGFDELMVRCGLENNGAPFEERVVHPDGSLSHTTFGLHGRIANIPAHHVAVHIATEPPYELTVEGRVDEARLFAPQVRLTTTIRTTPGSNRLVVRDTFTNLGETPGAMQVLYHWNFGEPFLEAGARLVAPARTVVPRDARARAGIEHYAAYAGPEPGFAEQVYFFELLGGPPDGRTVALLRNRAGDKAVALRFSTRELPAFTLWKNTGGLRDGYVTGLEPATNYPNPRPFEQARGRVVTLAPGGSHQAEMVLEVFDTRDGVAAVEAEIDELQRTHPPRVHAAPVEPFASAAD